MKYDVILSDPPWSFSTWSKKGQGRTAEVHYPTMPPREILALGEGVKAVSAPNCALFLWVTTPNLPLGIACLEAWGFQFKTAAFAWAKLSRGSRWLAPIEKIKWHFGMGYYSRANVELCLLGVKGKMPVADRGVPQLIVAPVREHSRKPDEQYGRIQRLYPTANKLELFCRDPQPGWTASGNAVVHEDIRTSLARLSDGQPQGELVLAPGFRRWSRTDYTVLEAQENYHDRIN